MNVLSPVIFRSAVKQTFWFPQHSVQCFRRSLGSTYYIDNILNDDVLMPSEVKRNKLVFGKIFVYWIYVLTYCVYCDLLKSINNIAVCIMRCYTVYTLNWAIQFIPKQWSRGKKNLHTQYHPLWLTYLCATQLCTVCFPAMHCTRCLDSIVSEKTNVLMASICWKCDSSRDPDTLLLQSNLKMPHKIKF